MRDVLKRYRLFRAGLISAAIALCFGIFAANETAAQGPLGQILNRMDAHYKGLSSLHSDVTMVKTDSGLGVSDTTKGNTSFLPEKGNQKMYARIDWTWPLQEQMVVIGNDYKLYRPKLNQVIVGTTNKAAKGSAGSALSFISMSKDQLKANFDVVYVAEEKIDGGTTTTWHLRLTPKKPTSYKLAELWVDGDGMPRQAKVTENNNDSTTILLSNIEKNIKIKSNVFKLDYPKSTKEVKA